MNSWTKLSFSLLSILRPILPRPPSPSDLAHSTTSPQMSDIASGGLPSPPLSQGAGYGVIVGLGALFAIVVVLISKSLVKYANLSKDAEEFAVAKRSLVSLKQWNIVVLRPCWADARTTSVFGRRGRWQQQHGLGSNLRIVSSHRVLDLPELLLSVLGSGL